MTPKEKALELIEAFWINVRDYRLAHPAMTKEQAKQCALIAVDEITHAIDFDWMEVQNLEREHAYWDKVKEEIEKL